MSEVKWFYSENNEQRGPVSFEQLRGILHSGQIPATALIWRKGLSGWVPANQCPEFAESATFQPAQQPARASSPGTVPVYQQQYEPGQGAAAYGVNPAPAYGQSPPAPVYGAGAGNAAAGELGDLVSQAMDKRRKAQEAEALKAMDEKWQERQRQEKSQVRNAGKPAGGPKIVRPAAYFFYVVAFITCAIGIATVCLGKSPLAKGASEESHFAVLCEGIGYIIGGLIYAVIAFFGRTVGWVYIAGIVLYALDAILLVLSGNIGGLVIRVVITGALIRGYAGKPADQ